ncbi:hypothetical protein L596_022772 [Steinernema carpocapsae]|uniref:Syndecan/Neurexin domain-containing protein n=1 Tax=Steinernema carpocapsae TaxID=34508 RepID=A0A4V6A0B6_STECR|nr:hypothetical protein L596_022772 [Steinernema carpocapsae]
MIGRFRWIALALIALVTAEFRKAEDLAIRNWVDIRHIPILGPIIKKYVTRRSKSSSTPSTTAFDSATTEAFEASANKENAEAPESGSNTGLIVGIVCGILGLLILIGIVFAVYWFVIRKKKAGQGAVPKGKDPKKMPDTVELIDKESKLDATMNGFKTVE